MSCKNVQILNFNHNIVEVGPDNKIVITDQVKCNSITIPQPVTCILQVNSPGPQGAQGAPGASINTSIFVTTSSFNNYTGSSTSQFAGTASYATTASYVLNAGTTINTGSFVTTSSFNTFTSSYNTFSGSYNTGSFSGSFTGSFNGTASWAYSASNAINSLTASYINPLNQNVIITGSLTVSGSSTFTNIGPAIFSGSVGSNSGFTGSFNGDGSNLTNLPTQVAGNTGEIQYNVGGGFGGVSTLTYNGSLVTATNISATGSFNGPVTEYITSVSIGQSQGPAPIDPPPPPPDVTITQTGTYTIARESDGYGEWVLGSIYFPDPSLYTGQRLTIRYRAPTTNADIGNNGHRPKAIDGTAITALSKNTAYTFISDGTDWLEI